MSNTSPKNAARADDLARYSVAAGVLAVALWVIARTLVWHLSATEVNTRHPEFDWTSLLAPAQGYICAVLAVALGIAGLLHRDKTRTWAVVGTTIGGTFLVIMLAEILAKILVTILPLFFISEPGPQQ